MISTGHNLFLVILCFSLKLQSVLIHTFLYSLFVFSIILEQFTKGMEGAAQGTSHSQLPTQKHPFNLYRLTLTWLPWSFFVILKACYIFGNPNLVWCNKKTLWDTNPTLIMFNLPFHVYYSCFILLFFSFLYSFVLFLFPNVLQRQCH